VLDEKAVLTPGTDEWWFSELGKELGSKIERINNLESWMAGNPPLIEPDGEVKEGYRRIQEMARLNVAQLIVKSSLHRLAPSRFKTAADSDALGDDEAMRIWRYNDMDSVSKTILEWMLTFGESYALVQSEKGEGKFKGKKMATISAEHPYQTIIRSEHNRPSRAIAGLKVMRNEYNNGDIAVIFRKGYHRIARHEGPSVLPSVDAPEWEVDMTSWTMDPKVYKSATNTIPLVRFSNAYGGKGEFEEHIPTLMRINKQIQDKLTIIMFQAFRQRVMTDGKPEEVLDEGPEADNEEDREPHDFKDIFDPKSDFYDLLISDPGSVWRVPFGTTMWESATTEITPLLQSIRDELKHLAAVSMVPLHIIEPDSANGSATGAASMKESNLAKIKDIQKSNSYSYQLMMALCFETEGDTKRADVTDIQVEWEKAEISSITDRASAASQLLSAKNPVPFQLVMEEFLELPPEKVTAAMKSQLVDAFMEGIRNGVTADTGTEAATTDIPNDTQSS
jgi:hypothetical protein